MLCLPPETSPQQRIPSARMIQSSHPNRRRHGDGSPANHRLCSLQVGHRCKVKAGCVITIFCIFQICVSVYKNSDLLNCEVTKENTLSNKFSNK